MTAIDFKPSDVKLEACFPPLTDTLGRVEREAAATLIVRVCQIKGDVWQPVMPKEIGEILKADREAKIEPLASLATSPFWRPDIFDCVELGFARWIDGDDGKGPVELTEKGLEALRRWVRR